MRKSGLLLVVLAGAGSLGLGACGGDKGNVFSLEVGQCFNNPDGFGSVSDVEILDCDDPHEFEVFHAFELDDGDYPGDAAIGTESQEGCFGDAFTDFVGVEYSQSLIYGQNLSPTEQSWDGGDREVLCLAYETEDNGATPSETSGSLEGANR